MATVSKRVWEYNGQLREAWVVRYNDGTKWRLKTFQKKKAADDWLRNTTNEIADGTHVPERASKTMGEAGDAWLAAAEADGLEPSTIKGYREHLTLHVKPFLGNVKIARLNKATAQKFRQDLRAAGRSPVMVDRVVKTLNAILAEAGVSKKVMGDSPRDRRRRKQAKRQQKRVTIPDKAEIRAIIAKASGRWRALIITGLLTGLRSSELRGLTWDDIDLKVLTVRQRADAWGTIGEPKSDAGKRDIPLAPMVVNTLKEWRLQCPRRHGELVLVFLNGQGNVESHANILNRGFWPLQIAAGITKSSKSGPKAKYSLHALRHVAASLFIEQGMNPKKVQTLMGHSSIQMTFDRYGHLWTDRDDDQKQMAQVQARLLG